MADTLTAIVGLFTDLSLTAYVGIGAVIGAVAFLIGRLTKFGR